MGKQNDNKDLSGDPVELPIDGILDLHTFNPRDVKELLPEYVGACRLKGIYEIRVIHGKGTGALRETVHSILRRLPGVASFRTAGEDAGGWGATLVSLEPD
ncbi:MAG: Smr/MutS family protein [Nitrospiraceae bacterium]|nr:Smr/MutS family protein [Nitrospiraceae bacterium]